MRLIIGLLVGIVVGIIGLKIYEINNIRYEPIINKPIEKPLLKYTIENLGKREYSSQIILDEITASSGAFFVQKFHFDSDGKNVTGLAHIPNSCEKCPVILQIRGYAEPVNYQSGYGTWRSAEKYAEAGFISIAPDFLGYGGSASPSADVFEARFETYTTALNLLSAIEKWDRGNGKIGIWGHSNGGQIALTILEISQKEYPTVLWAPVSAGFPYSIIYYMDGNEEGDIKLRNKLTDFEKIYDANQFNLLNYTDKIKAPIQLHQGGMDISVPQRWSDTLVKKLSNVKYYVYPGADHNLLGAWSQVVERDIDFFRTTVNNE